MPGLLLYDGINLPFNEMSSGDESVEYSEDGIDVLRLKRTYTIDSVFTPDAIHCPAILAGLPANFTAAQLLNAYQCHLRAPRKQLEIIFGNGDMLFLPAGADAKGGPFPEIQSFTNFAGSSTCHIKYRITCYTSGCCDDISATPDNSVPTAGSGAVGALAGGVGGGGKVQWRSNRWTESVDLSGDDFRTTKTRSGKIVINAGANVIDAFRGTVTPTLPPGFLRTKANYQIATDGLSMSYTFVDEEQWAMPPPGAVKATGTSRISADRGIWKFVEVTLRLHGDVKQDKNNLLKLAVTVVMNKLNSIGVARQATGKNAGKWMATSGYIMEQMYENKIEVSVRSLVQPNTKNQINVKVQQAKDFVVGLIDPLGIAAGIAGLFAPAPPAPNAAVKPGDAMPVPKGLDPNFGGIGPKPWGSEGAGTQPDMGLYSTAGLVMIAAAFRDPCLQATISQIVTLTGSGGMGDPSPAPNAGVDPELKSGSMGNFIPPAAAPNAPLPGQPGFVPLEFFAIPSSAPTANATSVSSGSIVSNIVLANVSFVDNPTDPTQQISTDSGISALYTDYQVHLKIEKNYNNVVMVEQRAGGKTHVIPTSAMSKKLVMEWSCQRVGEPPTIPQEDCGDSNCVILNAAYNPGSTEVDESGNLLCSSAGRYEYQFLDPSQAERAGTGMPPWASELLGGPNEPIVYDGPQLVSTTEGQITSDMFAQNLQKWQNIANADSGSGYSTLQGNPSTGT